MALHLLLQAFLNDFGYLMTTTQSKLGAHVSGASTTVYRESQPLTPLPPPFITKCVWH